MSRWLLAIVWIGCATSSVHAQIHDDQNVDTVRGPEQATTESTVTNRPRIAEAIVERTNRFRSNKDRQAVKVDERLAETAQYFAEYMARTNRYGHTADGQRPSQRAKQHEYDYCLVSENIAYQYSSAGFEPEQLIDRFVKGWKQSPGHRKNMLDPDVTETGVAVAQSDETGYIYAVQMFGRPESARIEFQVVNRSGEQVDYQIGDQTFPLPPRYSRTHQRCRPATLAITWQDGDDERTRSIKPSGGARILITGKGEQLRIRQQVE
jgi:uncharacterized protein YkwD